MTDRFNNPQASLAATQVYMLSLGNRMKEMENASSNYDCRLSQVEQTCTKLQSKKKALCLKVIDREGRSRRQNIKVTGLPEKIRNGCPTELGLGLA